MMKSIYLFFLFVLPSIGFAVDKMEVTADELNVRTAPDKNAESAGMVYDGEIVDVIEIKDGWAEIKWKGETGYYVHSDYLKDVNSASENKSSAETPSTKQNKFWFYLIIFIVGGLFILYRLFGFLNIIFTKSTKQHVEMPLHKHASIPKENLKEEEPVLAFVEIGRDWISTKDVNGKTLGSLSSENKTVLGSGADFFVVLHGSYYYTYDLYCKKIGSKAVNNKTFVNATGTVILLKTKDWMESFDKNWNSLGSQAIKK